MLCSMKVTQSWRCEAEFQSKVTIIQNFVNFMLTITNALREEREDYEDITETVSSDSFQITQKYLTRKQFNILLLPTLYENISSETDI